MITHNLIQGTPEWHAYRADHFNASDAPAVMGHSSYKTRNQLLKERATGIVPEVDASVQRRFDDGHRFEALARPLAEAIIGDDLFPVTGSLGKYSASFDGLTMDETINNEHKTLNDTLRAAFDMIDTIDPKYRDLIGGEELPIEYRIQMEQQCMVAGCEKVLFMASKWQGDQLVEERHCWYFPNGFLRRQIVAAWDQFHADLANYQHVEIVEPIKVTQETSFPVVVLNVTGSLSSSNLDNVTPKFDLFLSTVNTDLKTDEDFAHGESDAKLSRSAAKALRAKAKEVVDQVVPISDAIRTLESYAVKFDAMALKLEKACKEEKDNIKLKIILQSKDKYASHIADLNKRIGTNYLSVQYPDFATAVKNKRTVASLHDACDTLLAQSKIAVNEVAERIQLNLETKGLTGYQFLFSDMPVLVHKANDDFLAVVSQRITQHEVKEAERIAAETARIAEQERIKAEAKAAAELAAAREADRVEQARIAAEGVAAARALAVAALAEIKAASPVFLAPAIDQPVACEAWSAAVSPQADYAPTIHVHRPRAATRALVDNILDTLPEADMQYLLNYLQTMFVKQAA